ncbi:MAG: helix-turn-helix domain-containing protein [Verrucomicrobiota bacterium]|nr:helix-turn-helix domain-containing protein [Verrucomicrobiota bacterium]
MNKNYIKRSYSLNLKRTRKGFVKIIQHAIDQSGGNVSAAARLLDVPRDYIRYRQKKSGK